MKWACYIAPENNTLTSREEAKIIISILRIIYAKYHLHINCNIQISRKDLIWFNLNSNSLPENLMYMRCQEGKQVVKCSTKVTINGRNSMKSLITEIRWWATTKEGTIHQMSGLRVMCSKEEKCQQREKCKTLKK